MKYVYVLTCSPSDYYYEQFLLSVTSLRLFNPDAFIVALIDSDSKQSLASSRAAYEKVVSETIVVSPPVEFSQKEVSRWIKTSIPHYVSGAFLYIDCDTVITETITKTLSESIPIGAVLDNHVTLNDHHLKQYFQKEDIEAGFASSLKSNYRYNGGVVFCNSNSLSLEFYEKWHSLWLESLKKKCSQDMPSLNQANFEMNNVIVELAGEWNCQISHNGLPFLSDAKIIHYYATSLKSLEPAFLFASLGILKPIKENGSLPPETLALLEKPKKAFRRITRIIADDKTIDALDHSFFFKLTRFNKRNPGIKKKIKALISHIYSKT